MVRPLDSITAFHNAFRRDIGQIDRAALAWARGETDAPVNLDRYRFLNEILVWHANGEEAAVFPFVEREASRLSEPYIQDHHGLDRAYEHLDQAVAEGDALQAARATAAFKFHLDLHLAKEDSQIYPLVKERIRLPEEQGMVGMVASMVPRERFAEAVSWLFPLLGENDRTNMLRIYQMLMPPELFQGAQHLVQEALGDEWAPLAARVGLPV